MRMPSNKEFIDTIFGEDAPWCHVTDFTHAPDAQLSQMDSLIAWKGDYYSRYQFNAQPSNQYFTISTFMADNEGVARRRKALFRMTHCIVLDDVKEKLVQSEVDKLPAPSWILESSEGSEQWGYILTEPSTERNRVENLLDGLIANGLAPDGKDSGMKGVTRYVRLPEGINNKSKKLVNGQPFNCRITAWNPFNRVTLEQLAEPLAVDLDRERRETQLDGASDVPDHPLLHTDCLHIKEVRSDGRFDITCPWVDEHTGADDSGSAIFTNKDGSLGFKCHHGNCQEKTGRDLVNFIERNEKGFKEKLSHFQSMQEFKTMVPAVDAAPVVDVTPTVDAAPAPAPDLMSELRKHPATTKEARDVASIILKNTDQLPVIEKQHIQEEVREYMRWSKNDFKNILTGLRNEWYESSTEQVSFFEDVIFVSELNQFFNRNKKMFFTPEAYQNTYAHLDAEARKQALQGGRVTKVDRLDFVPNSPAVFEEEGVTYGNTWCREDVKLGYKGDVTPWLNHFDTMGWGQYREHILQWMAFTILHPEQKINHMIIMGGPEGCGKDFLLYPLAKAMGKQEKTIMGDELLKDFNPYLLSAKYLNINETELGDRREAVAVANKLKPYSAGPPETLTVNDKNVKHVTIRNIVNCTMTTNSTLPIRLNGPSRRMLCLWTDLNIRDDNLDLIPEWGDFWNMTWNWMKNGGAEACIWYLRNCVDLSNFDAGRPPPMTDFLRDIIGASKSPLDLTIEGMIKHGVMPHDLMTAEDINQAMKGLFEFPPAYCFMKSLAMPTTVENALSRIQGVMKYRTDYGNIYVVRGVERYRNRTADEIIKMYEMTRPNLKTPPPVQNNVVPLNQEGKTNERTTFL